MVNQTKENSITISRESVQTKGGLVILPLSEYERLKEDLEMSHSQKLIKEIQRARKEVKNGALIELDELERKLDL